MPLIPAGLSSFNEKVESARKGFNSTLDKAGHKSGVFKAPAGSKPSPPSLPSTSTAQPYSARPPPPPRNAFGAPPPPPSRNNLPPPPPRRQGFALSNPPGSENYGPPPPISRKPSLAPSTPYRPPPSPLNGYGPPTMAPVQHSTRYGPPSPPPPDTHPDNFSPAQSKWQRQPPACAPPPITLKKPTGWQPPNSASTPPPYAAQKHKHGQIPFPPFSQFTEADKLAFFEMLDEFFGRRFPDRKPAGPLAASRPAGSPPPPLVSRHTRPSMASIAREPPPSRAQAIASYMSGYRHWSSHADQWYTTDDPVPTPAQGSSDVKRMSSWTQTGNSRTQLNYIFFPDLSQLWTSVTFDVSRPFPPRTAAARFRPPPGPMDTATLVAAAETYGPQLALFAEDAERSGRHVARGECWDLANEALRAFPAGRLGVPAPLTSISRTHGTLLYHGRATGRGQGTGEWKAGGDVGNARRGDVIEWRLVACDTVNPTLSCTLGDPEHTAIIVDARYSSISTPTAAPPSQLGHITVVEQSLKQIPVRRTYDLSTMSRGEVWIYRPMSEADLLGEGRDQCVFPPPEPSYEA